VHHISRIPPAVSALPAPADDSPAGRHAFSRRQVSGGALGLLALGLAGGLAGCRRGGAGLDVVNLAAIAYPYKGGQVLNGLNGVVEEQGWLKGELGKRGIALNFVPVPTAVGAPQINEGFSGRKIDFASYGDFPAIIADAGGVPLKLVAPAGQGQDVYLVVRKDLPARSIADLKGKRIALHRGRPWELPFSKLLDSAGLTFADFTIVNINPQATPAALAGGSVDATVLLSDGLLLEQKGIGRVIWSTKQAPADWKMRAELFARGDFVADHPEITQLVVSAFVRAARWSADEANKAQVIANAARGSMPTPIIEADYASTPYSWRERFSPLFRPAIASHYRSVADYALAHGLIHAPVDTGQLIEPRFVAQAIRDLGLTGFWSDKDSAA